MSAATSPFGRGGSAGSSLAGLFASVGGGGGGGGSGGGRSSSPSRTPGAAPTRPTPRSPASGLWAAAMHGGGGGATGTPPVVPGSPHESALLAHTVVMVERLQVGHDAAPTLPLSPPPRPAPLAYRRQSS